VGNQNRQVLELKSKVRDLAPVATSYSGSRGQEVGGSKPAQANSSLDPILNTHKTSKQKINKTKHVWWSGSSYRVHA
jgi:hypothetical protein